MLIFISQINSGVRAVQFPIIRYFSLIVFAHQSSLPRARSGFTCKIMRKFNLKAREKSARGNFKREKLSEILPKVGENERDSTECTIIKTLAGARWEEMGKVKKELKAMLPILKPSEVKRFYLPFHEAIIDELEEDGYMRSANYLKELFELDEKIRKEAGPDTLIWKKPRLRDNKDATLRLKEGLIAFEQAKNVGDSTCMTMEFLNMALFFQAMTWEWWWVAEQLYRSALSNLTESDDRRVITLIYYLYGRFLVEQMRDAEESLYHLKIAREESQEKMWNASRITGRTEGTIFRECNMLLYKALLMHAQRIESDQPDIAGKAYAEAVARATDSEYHEYMANALHQLGKNQLQTGDMKLAFKNFFKFLAMAKRIPDPEGICNAHLALAFAYKLSCGRFYQGELNDAMNTEKHFRLSREHAAESGLTRKLAQAHYYTGEYFSDKKKLDIAISHLEMSSRLYNELGLYDDADKARIIAGVSKGQGIISQYIDLILKCGVDTRAISMLCQWKDRKIAFWIKEELHAKELKKFELEHIEKATSSSLFTDATNTAEVSLKNLI